jgi:Flp pilus assembly protein TadG
MRFKALSAIMPRPGNLLRAMGAATDGVAVVETALIAPVLAIVIVGVIDTAGYGAAKLESQQAVNRGLEMAMMGGPSLSTSEIQNQTATQAGVSTSQVTVTQILECSGTTTSWSSSCATGQETARYIQIQISTTYTPLFALGSLAKLYGNSDGIIPISTSQVIRIQ